MDIMTGGNCSQFRVLIWNSFIGQVVHPLGGKGMEVNVILARCKVHFIREHENVVQHPSNNISIVRTVAGLREQEDDEPRYSNGS